MRHFGARSARLTVILHVAPISSSHRLSGLFFAVPGLVKALLDAGACVGLLTSGADPFCERQPFRVLHWRSLPGVPFVSRCPAPFGHPDLVVIHSTYVPIHALIALECRLRQIPYVLVPHGGLTRGAQSKKRLKKRLGNALFLSHMVGGAAAIHCLSAPEAEDTRLWGRPTFVVGNGVTLPPGEDVAKPGSRSGLGLVFIGRLDIAHKGLDILLEGCRLLRNTLVQERVRLTLYGPSVEGSAAFLRGLVREYGLEGAVAIEGPVQGSEKRRALSSADIFVHTSRFEGQPLSVLEALSYGLPCLVTPGTGVAEDVVAAHAGWQTDPSAEGVAEALMRIMESRKELCAMGRRARELAEVKYSWDRVGTEALKRYEETLLGCARSAPEDSPTPRH